jgi:hypothetical protein
MKRAKSVVLAGSLLFCISAVTDISASKPTVPATRIHFKRGESSATVSGRLTSRRLKQAFLIGAKAGQEMSVGIKAKTSDGLDFANLMIFDPSGKTIAADDGGAVKTRLKQTGDYRIEVTPPGSFYREKLTGYKDLRFALSVRVD